MSDELEARIAKLEADLVECNRLRLCENQATARAIEAMREAKAEAKSSKNQADYFAGLISDMAEELGIRPEVPSTKIFARIKELRKAEKNDRQGTA